MTEEGGPLSDLLLSAAAACLLSVLFVRLSIPVLTRRLPDVPNERSSHTRPVPRGGGIGVLLAIGGGLALYGSVDFTTTDGALLASALVLAIMSVMDDAKPLSAAARIGLQICLIIPVLLLFQTERLLPDIMPVWLLLTLAGLSWVWFVNLYNFMDGIDGITSVETISIGAGVCLVWWLAGMPESWRFHASVLAIAAGALTGFLVWNRHPARIFLGDVGSIPLGFLLGAALLFMALNGEPEAAVILPLYYLADATLTLLKRLFRGEKVWLAHREHFYQRASNENGRGPVAVVKAIAFTNIGLIGCAAYSVDGIPGIGTAIALLLVSILLLHLNRRSR